MTPGDHVAGGRPEPVRFVFGVHLHQPVGNFDHVFADHVKNVYLPLVDQLTRRSMTPAALHMSGPLLEWLEAHDTTVLDRIGRLAADGSLELLLAGMYEPILAAIPRADRVDQIGWLREALRARFGVAGDGLWLTERVWEPELASDLAAAGVRYVLVDDRHFLVTGMRQEDLHVPYRTENDGAAVSVMAIDERLRYLIPFRPPLEIAEYLRGLHAAGQPLAIFADDGEKFGGWPGTHKWVYERGWFDAFCDVLDTLRADGTIRMSTGREAIDAVPSGGLVYLPTASYREMEGWALPALASRRLAIVERDLGETRMNGPDSAVVRGSHWRNFLVKYTESNRMQKKAAALSVLCRRLDDPPAARRAIGRAQCNDALWHGVFGGLYLPHLRGAVWYQLAIAEGVLREGEALGAQTIDIDGDGEDEVWVHGAHISAIVAPARGGALVELTRFAAGVNHADTLTRRLEAYHLPPITESHHPDASGTPSIHDLEQAIRLDAPPPVDLDDRAIGVARLVSSGLTRESYAAATYTPRRSWARARLTPRVEIGAEAVVVHCESPGFTVSWRIEADGAVTAGYRWGADVDDGEGSYFAPELSLAHPMAVSAPDAVAIWRYDIETVAKSESGLERVRQGEAVTPLFDGARRQASFTLAPLAEASASAQDS